MQFIQDMVFCLKMLILLNNASPVILNLLYPRSETIKKMGDKSMARETVSKAGVPIIPGSNEATCKRN